MNTLTSPEWSVERAAQHYGINDWGAGYFRISEAGEVTLRISTTENGGNSDTDANNSQVSLLEIARGLKQRDLDMPLLLRVENILDAGIRQLNTAFADAIAALGYQNHYRGVFPIKVNQQCHVVEEIARFGKHFHHGFEAGSKAELIIAMASLQDRDSLIVCNGYKDSEFIDLGLRARQLGIPCVFVIETPAELPIIIERSRVLGIEPMVGLRLKLMTKVDGHWSNDSGDRSLFGLTTTQIIEIIDGLKAANMLSCLQLLHFHLGSQIPNIRDIRAGVQEACRYYIDIIGEGAPLGYLDLGGGLAVDYDGSRSNDTHSRNYNLREYCTDIVEAIQEALDPESVPHPVIVTESGRATVAYTSVLLFNVLDTSTFSPSNVPQVLPEDSNEQIKNLWTVLGHIAPRTLQECYNDAIHYRSQLQELFLRSEINLRTRSLGENIYLNVLQNIAAHLPHLERIPAELEDLQGLLADIYYGNFSVFQSLPDAWAIKQVFPIMPIHRLDEQPTREAIIADLTCDCDGKIDHFPHPEGPLNTLSVHPLRDGEEYYMGVFLVGAYQETLGDLHNLFGDTNVASVRINNDGSFDFVHELEGDSIADVLSYVEYDPKIMYERFRATAEQAVREGRITVLERQKMLGAFTESLRGYTYFER